MNKLMEPIKRRVYLMIGRALLRAVSDDGARQFVQISALRGETKDNVERVQQYGFTSNPLPGAQAVFVCVGGNRDHPIVINIDDPRHRKSNLNPGEVCAFSHTGDYLYFKNDSSIEIVTDKLLIKASEKIRMETPLLEVTGDVIDRADENTNTLQGMRDIYNRHVHPENDQSGPTDQPISGDQMS